MDKKISPAVGYWLLSVAAMVFIMAIIGAMTRLTESGLSITEWKPLTGAIPPLSQADWDHAFALYRATPQYEQVFKGMSLAEFKVIFWWEWAHRQWGRVIGLAYALPLAWFWLRGHLPAWLKPRLLLLLGLGGLQAAIGWFMVASGLVDMPSVSHYRLALHLSTALLLFALLVWTALQVLEVRTVPPAKASLRRHGLATLGVLALTIVWGAFVAGMDAGRIYNEFPFMGAGLMPEEAWHLRPLWLNFFENHAMVQFTHRCLAMLTALMVLGLVFRSGPSAQLTQRGQKLSLALGVMVIWQVALGVLTLLTHVNIYIATAHQAGALILLGLLVWWLYEAAGCNVKRHTPQQS